MLDFFAIIPIILGLLYFAIFFIVLYLVYKWVNKFLALKQEQNDLLREAIHKLGNNKL